MVSEITSTSVFPPDLYEVTANRLNIRVSPTAKGAVVGKVSKGDLLEIIDVKNSTWASFEYNGRTCYVSLRYLRFVRTLEDEPVQEDTNVNEVDYVQIEDTVSEGQESIVDFDVSQVCRHEVKTPLVFGHGLSKNINLYFAIQAGLGYSNFHWRDGTVYGDVSYSADIAAQLYFENKMLFIPSNWYSELQVGYDKRGAAGYGMNFIHLRFDPIGYRIPLSPINIVAKCGIAIGFPLSDVETAENLWNTRTQYGFDCGFAIEWRQFAIGCNFEYDFSDAFSQGAATLNNFAVLGTISYKFSKFGHKQ